MQLETILHPTRAMLSPEDYPMPELSAVDDNSSSFN